MFSAFLVSLREGVEAALIVGLCLVYLRKISRRDLERPVWYAVTAALLASVAVGYLFEQLPINQESFEGYLMLLAATLLVWMIVWMRRVARSLKGEIEDRVGHFASRGRLAAVGLFFFVFAMVFREGVETVIFLGAVSLNAQGALVILGTLLGLALAVLLGIFFFKGTLPIRLSRFFEATSIMLGVVVAQLVLTGIHDLSEGFVIPSGPRMMRILGPIVRNEIFFFVVLLGLTVWLVAREMLHHRHSAPAAGTLSEADEQRRLAQQRRERRWMTAAAATALLIVTALAAEHVYALGGTPLPDAIPVLANSDFVRIPLADVNDGALHHYRFSDGTTGVRFLVIRKPDGGIFTGLEACTICGAHGYIQQGDEVICRNCAARIPLSAIEVQGGCNPIPVASHLEGTDLIIPISGLTGGGARYFHRH